MLLFIFSDGGNVMKGSVGRVLRQKIKQFVHIVPRIDLCNLWSQVSLGAKVAATAAAAFVILIK